MNRTTLDNILPKQNKGRKAKVQLSVTSNSVNEATRLYEFLKLALVDVNNWMEFQPGINLYPRLMNRTGVHLRRMAQSGDLIKIILPRWQSPGRLVDWREIANIEERLTENAEIFFISIVPALNPEMDLPEASHFLKPESSVTFFVIRDEEKLQLEVHTRNEGLNSPLPGLKTKLQTIMMSVFIAGGFYEAQWSRLMKSILKYGMLHIRNARQ
jgi:hypothetical protein